MQAFLRPTKDLAKTLDELKVKQSTTDRISIMRACCNLNERFDDREVKRMQGDIVAYVNEQKTMLEHLKAFKATLKNIVPLKMQERQYYGQFAKFLAQYEETKDKASGTGELAHVKLVSGQGGDYLKAKLEGLAAEFQNPMIHISHWVKGEMYSLDALTQCVNEMIDIDNQKRKAQADIIEIQHTIDKLNTGKFTFGSMLKSDAEKKASAVQKQQAKAELEVDVVNFDQVKKILTLYIDAIAIPQYKRKSAQRYIEAMGKMCNAEVENASSISDCWI